MSELKSSGKPFDISKREVWDAYLKVKENQGAAGVDGCTLEGFEKDLQGNLYKIWNRMSSGSYFPSPVKGVRGWMQYYGAFYQTELYPLLQRINYYLLRWVRKKHKRLKTYKKATRRWDQVVAAYPAFFAHWKWVNVT